MPLMLPRPAHTLTGGGMNGKAASFEEQIAAATASKVRREGSRRHWSTEQLARCKYESWRMPFGRSATFCWC